MTGRNGLLTSFETWRAAAFLLGGLLFVADAAYLAANIVSGVENPALTLGQAFVGAGWTCAFIGVLGVYPGLADRSRWLPRAGAVFAVIGTITMAAMATTSLGYYSGVLGGELADVTMYFLPGVFLGIVLGFGPFGVASLQTGIYSRSVGLLFLLLVLTFLFNLGSGIAGFGTLTTVLGVVCVLALTMLTLGYLFRTGRALADRDGTSVSSEASAG